MIRNGFFVDKKSVLPSNRRERPVYPDLVDITAGIQHHYISFSKEHGWGQQRLNISMDAYRYAQNNSVLYGYQNPYLYLYQFNSIDGNTITYNQYQANATNLQQDNFDEPAIYDYRADLLPDNSRLIVMEPRYELDPDIDGGNVLIDLRSYEYSNFSGIGNLINTKSNVEITSTQNNRITTVGGVSFSPPGTGYQGKIYVFSATISDSIPTYSNAQAIVSLYSWNNTTGIGNFIKSVAYDRFQEASSSIKMKWSPCGRHFVMLETIETGVKYASIWVWDDSINNQSLSRIAEVSNVNFDNINNVHFSPDGNYLATLNPGANYPVVYRVYRDESPQYIFSAANVYAMPNTLPAPNANVRYNSINFNSTGDVIFVSYKITQGATITPYIHAYAWSEAGFGTKYDDFVYSAYDFLTPYDLKITKTLPNPFY